MPTSNSETSLLPSQRSQLEGLRDEIRSHAAGITADEPVQSGVRRKILEAAEAECPPHREVFRGTARDVYNRFILWPPQRRRAELVLSLKCFFDKLEKLLQEINPDTPSPSSSANLSAASVHAQCAVALETIAKLLGCEQSKQ